MLSQIRKLKIFIRTFGLGLLATGMLIFVLSCDMHFDIRDQNIEPIRKSMNFSPTNFPKNTPIHNFYRHNFDK